MTEIPIEARVAALLATLTVIGWIVCIALIAMEDVPLERKIKNGRRATILCILLAIGTVFFYRFLYFLLCL